MTFLTSQSHFDFPAKQTARYGEHSQPGLHFHRNNDGIDTFPSINVKNYVCSFEIRVFRLHNYLFIIYIFIYLFIYIE